MQTVTIDIMNEKVLLLLQNLENLKLIRMRDNTSEQPKTDWLSLKGSMSKQSIDEIDDQLNQLREEWE